MHTRESQDIMYALRMGRALAAALGTDPGAALIPTATVRLWKDEAFNPTPDTVTADFLAAEADFTDYVAKSFTPGVPANLGQYVPGASGTVTWTMTTDPVVTTNTIWGYWVSSGGEVWAFERFAEGREVEMVNVGDQLVLTVALPMPLIPEPLA